MVTIRWKEMRSQEALFLEAIDNLIAITAAADQTPLGIFNGVTLFRILRSFISEVFGVDEATIDLTVIERLG